jgi:regulator of sirC expression with transglutaminase-like and TPR domain
MLTKSLKVSEYRALVSLLADEDVKILHTVWEHLLKVGPQAIPYLREASDDPDPRKRIRARHIMARISAEALEAQFRTLASRDEDAFDFEEGILTVARIEYPELDREMFHRQLDALATALRERLRGVTRPIEIIQAINSYLFDELKFTGNSSDYYNLDNAFMNRVLEKRTGIPISLSSLYLLIGERLGMPLKGVGLPGHFLVRFDDGASEIYIDPYNSGRLLSRKDCAQYLTGAGYYFKEEYIATSSSRDIIIRTLRHLVLIYSKQPHKPRVRQLTHYIELLRTPEKGR